MDNNTQQLQKDGIQKESSAGVKITLSKKRLYIIILGILIIIIGIFVFFFYNNVLNPQNAVIATVNNEPIYTSYLEKEMEFYPGKKTDSVKKMLTQKIVEDEIILKAAKKEGLINESYDFQSPGTEQYLKRTKAVSEVKGKIALEANGTTVKIVSIWFFNNFSAGPAGYSKGKEIALEKISKLYSQVKNKEITMEQAGKIIASDLEIAKLDTAFKENAFVQIKAEKGDKMTFWPEFDEQLWQLNKGEFTEIFTGTDTDEKGKTVPILYMFGLVSEKVVESNIENFDKWLLNNKKLYEVTYY